MDIAIVFDYLPVAQSTKFELVINAQRMLDLTVPLLLEATAR